MNTAIQELIYDMYKSRDLSDNSSERHAYWMAIQMAQMYIDKERAQIYDSWINGYHTGIADERQSKISCDLTIWDGVKYYENNYVRKLI